MVVFSTTKFEQEKMFCKRILLVWVRLIASSRELESMCDRFLLNIEEYVVNSILLFCLRQLFRLLCYGIKLCITSLFFLKTMVRRKHFFVLLDFTHRKASTRILRFVRKLSFHASDFWVSLKKRHSDSFKIT
uniref:Ovule protein n=1 Tax=Heterorhabditis bacteriophora TaxID=37862 RepID=A0A1I7WHL1_HETBA